MRRLMASARRVDHPNLPVHAIEGLAFTAHGGAAVLSGTNPRAISARHGVFLAR
jgi:hypothetical protein